MGRLFQAERLQGRGPEVELRWVVLRGPQNVCPACFGEGWGRGQDLQLLVAHLSGSVFGCLVSVCCVLDTALGIFCSSSGLLQGGLELCRGLGGVQLLLRLCL